MKKVISLIAASLMMLCIFAGCTNGGTSDTGSGSSSQSSDSSSSSSSDSSSSESTSKTDYLAWNSDDWKAANDTEKANCTAAYFGYLAGKMGQSITDNDLSTAAQNTELIKKLDDLFGQMESAGFKSLKEGTDAAFDALASLAD